MKALRVALALVRVPRLFISLLFWPMVVGIFIAFGQISISSAYLGIAGESATQFEQRINTRSLEADWIRERLYGVSAAFDDIAICRWTTVDGIEQSQGQECQPQKMDIRLRTDAPLTTPVEEFVEHFSGSVRALHLCSACEFETAVLIDIDQAEHRTTVTSVKGLGQLSLVETTKQEQINVHFISAKLLIEKLKTVGGTILFSPPGVDSPINISEASRTMILIFNTSLLVVIALWLSLRGHRRVLDYFARNDALLPLVAACGKDTFYSAIWIITAIRVGFFLLMVTPATIIGFAKVAPSTTLDVFMHSELDFILWLFALLSSLSSLTIIASIAELKHRSSWISFLYKYIPIAVCAVGTVVWALSLFLNAEFAAILRNTVASCPILGISPVLLSPLIAVSPNVLAAHAILASLLVITVMRRNSRWFAAHLEEL